MAVIAYLFNTFVQLYTFVILAWVVLSWLIGFNVINRHNRFVDAVWRFCIAATEPALRPIRGFLPSMGGIDISPLVLLIGLQAVQIGVNRYIFTPLLNAGL